MEASCVRFLQKFSHSLLSVVVTGTFDPFWLEKWSIKLLLQSIKLLESPLDCKKIKPVNSKGNQPWIFIIRTDAEAEAHILCPPDVKNWLTGKDPDAGKDWRREEKRAAEDEMIEYQHRLNGHESKQTLGDGEGQRSSPWGCKELDTT